MEEIIRTTKTSSFTQSDATILVTDIAKKYLKENGISLSGVAYVTMFDNTTSYIFISLLDRNSLTVYGQICIFIEEKTSNYAFIYGLSISPGVRRRKYADVLIKIAEAVISKLEFDGSYLEATPGTWLVDWYKRLGYEVYTEDAAKNLVGLSKQFS